MGRLKDYVVNKYLTWKTGKNKEQRDWEAWYDVNVIYGASTIPNMFRNFKHIIVVDPDKFFQFDPFAWVPCEDAKQYLHPQRELGNNAVWRIERVVWDQWSGHWSVNGLGDQDKVFVATNSDEDAVMISLKYAG